MMPGLPVASIPQCKYNRHTSTCLELFQAMGRYEPSFIDAHQASTILCYVRSLKSRIKTRLFLDKLIISNKEVFEDFESDMAERIGTLCDPTRENAECNDTVKQNARS
jgi:hypothetical protein